MLVVLIDVLGTALDYALLMVREWWLLIAIVAFAWTAPPLPRVFTRMGEALERYASVPWRAALTAAALCLVWSTAALVIRGGPPPPAHDDLACLLGAEMFANGHASYPTHPLWSHFEQFHVLQVPSYASKYPIGNELLMALALLLTGKALIGSWLAAALACLGIFWALRAVLPARWAFAGACAAAIHPVMLNYSHALRGGGLAVLGGALLFGAMLRTIDAPSARLGAIAGAGLALLAMSRPYEGVVLAAGCAIALLVHRRRGLLVPALACAGVVLVGLIPIALHNHAVTGSYTNLPWAEYGRQYDPAPPLVWQKPGPLPHYRNEEFRYVFGQLYRGKVDRVRAPGGLLKELDTKAYVIRWMLASDPDTRREAFLWPLFLIPFVMLPRARIPAIVVAVFLLAPFSMYGHLLTQYLAPVAAAVAALMMLLVRALYGTRRGSWLAVAIGVMLVVNAVQVVPMRIGITDHDRLEAAVGEGKHLFLVSPHVFGVLYNGPEIDAQRVVWARDLGDNAALLEYYKDRQVWRVVPGAPGSQPGPHLERIR